MDSGKSKCIVYIFLLNGFFSVIGDFLWRQCQRNWQEVPTFKVSHCVSRTKFPQVAIKIQQIAMTTSKGQNSKISTVRDYTCDDGATLVSLVSKTSYNYLTHLTIWSFRNTCFNITNDWVSNSSAIKEKVLWRWFVHGSSCSSHVGHGNHGELAVEEAIWEKLENLLQCRHCLDHVII